MSTTPTPRDARERDAMARAIELSRRGLGRTSPNPTVGCVVLGADGRVIGEGWHGGPGRPHAEVVALEQAGAAARGSTVVVTLEPCNHVGRTGPCTRALLTAGVARVVYAVDDPSPAAAGGGAALAAAGVEVARGVLYDEAAFVNEPWLHGVRHGRPHVTWKFAATLDGRSAAADGTSRWITSQEARADVHVLRSEADAVVVGIGTVLADDPHLTVRREGVVDERQPLRVVLDAEGRTPLDASVRDDRAETIIVTAAHVGRAADGRGVDLHNALRLLYDRGVRAVLLEGGPIVAGAFVDQGLVDRVVAYLAPALLGRGRPALSAGQTGSTIDDIIRLDAVAVSMVGADVKIVGRPRH